LTTFSGLSNRIITTQSGTKQVKEKMKRH